MKFRCSYCFKGVPLKDAVRREPASGYAMHTRCFEQSVQEAVDSRHYAAAHLRADRPERALCLEEE